MNGSVKFTQPEKSCCSLPCKSPAQHRNSDALMFLARAASIASNASTTEHDELPSEYTVVVGSAPTGCAELDLLLTSAERAIMHTTPGAPASQQLWVARALASRADGLFTDGKAANDAGDVEGARKLFEHAFLALPRVAYLLSVANMHLKAEAPDVARAFYLRVLQTPHSLPTPPPTEAEAQMARRKLDEATRAAAAASARRASSRGPWRRRRCGGRRRRRLGRRGFGIGG